MNSPPQAGLVSQRPWLALTAWSCCSVLLLAVNWQPTTAALDADEIYWIGSAYYYNLAFEQRDWHHPDWRLLPARENPPVAKYLIGISLALTGQRIASPDMLGTFFALYQAVPGAWGKGPDYEKRAQVVARMDPDLYRQVTGGAKVQLPLETLVPARTAMLVCVVLASLLVLLFGRAMGSWLAGWIASQLLLVHPAVVFAYNHAASDAVALVFSTGAALLIMYFVRGFVLQPRMRLGPSAALSLAAGGLLGFACGAKMNSLIVVFSAIAAVGVSAVMLVCKRELKHATKLLGLAGAMIGMGCVVFIIVNPAIVKDLSGGLKACVAEHRATEQVQAGFLSGHLTNLIGKADAVATLAFFSRLGCIAIAVLAIGWAGTKAAFAVRFAAAWWLIGFAALTWWIPFSALRYIMPLLVPSALLVGWTLHILFGWCCRQVGASRPQRKG
jgi:hypothetical protein